MHSSVLTFAVGVGGVLVGAALVTVLQRSNVAPTPAAPKAIAAARGDEAPSGRSATDVILEAMRAQELAQARAAAQAPAAEPASSAGDALTKPMEPAELARAEAALREGKLETHARESRDARWAPKMEQKIGDDLAKIAEKEKFKPLSLECRSTSCLAQLEYGSYAEAFASRIELVTHDFGGNCARETFFAKAEDPAAPYRTEMLFQCGGDEGAAAE